MNNKELPPLPQPFTTEYDEIDKEDVPCYSPEQMRDYARASLAAQSVAQAPACSYPQCTGEQPADGSCCKQPFTSAMADAAERYWRAVGPNAHPLPAQFRWVDCFRAMLAAAPSPEASKPVQAEAPSDLSVLRRVHKLLVNQVRPALRSPVITKDVDDAAEAVSALMSRTQTEVPSDSTLKLAEMILADCGHSAAISTRLRDRVSERIERHLAAKPTAASFPSAKADGYALMPFEPTDEMEVAAENSYEDSRNPFPNWKSAYRAMLAAAPSPEAPQSDAERRQRAQDRFGRCVPSPSEKLSWPPRQLAEAMGAVTPETGKPVQRRVMLDMGDGRAPTMATVNVLPAEASKPVQAEAPSEPMRAHIEQFATRAGWKMEEGEGAFEFVQRKCYQQGWIDHGTKSRDREDDTSASQDQGPDTGRVSGESGPAAEQHNEHRTGQSGADREHDQRDCRGAGLHGASNLPPQVAQKPDFIYNGERGRDAEDLLDGYNHGTAFYASPVLLRIDRAIEPLTSGEIRALMAKHGIAFANINTVEALVRDVELEHGRGVANPKARAAHSPASGVVEQPIQTWQDRIKAAHPKSVAEHWPSDLKAGYMAHEIADLRAALTTHPLEQKPVAWRFRLATGTSWSNWRTDEEDHDRFKLGNYVIEYAYLGPQPEQVAQDREGAK